MTKEEWINRAYDHFVLCGVHADEKTWDWAELCYQCEEQAYEESGFPFRSPEEAVSEELICAGESQ